MSINLSKQKRDKMLETLRKIKENIEDDETLKNLSLIEYELTKKKYGLVWEEHEERVDKELKTQIPTFEEIIDKKILSNPNEKFNFLLEGDNLHSLYLLEKTHKGKIDFIYIDPPYNTGNKDFVYNDEYIEAENEYKHSKWLSFMEKRLQIAKRLLKPNGVIFVSIDRNEGFQLKLLMDEIFGEDALAADLHVETSVIAGPRRVPALNGSVVKTTEFILGYVNGQDKKIMKNPMYDYIQGFDTHYSCYYDENKDELVPLLSFLKQNDMVVSAFESMNLKLSLNNLGKVIYSNEKVKKWLYSDPISSHIFRKGDDDIKIPNEIVSKIKKETVRTYNNQIFTINTQGKTKSVFCYRDRIGECDDYYLSYGERTIRGNLWKGFSADGGNLAKEGGIAFKNGKKPKRLIKQLIKSCLGNKDNAIILDFFAGSGTTAQAVLELNDEDNLHRNFILCTNNENNICQNVTYKRLLNINYGKENCKKIRFNLAYYKTSFVPRLNDDEENIQENLLFNIKNLIQLENGIDIDNKKIRVILSEKEVDDFSIKENEVLECEKLYLSSDILLTAKQTKIFKENNIEVFIIPEYYFDEEIKEVL